MSAASLLADLFSLCATVSATATLVVARELRHELRRIRSSQSEVADMLMMGVIIDPASNPAEPILTRSDCLADRSDRSAADPVAAPPSTRPEPYSDVPATWRGMTGLSAANPVAGITLMTFDGERHQFALSDLDLWRMIEQIADTLPGLRARQLRTFFQASSEVGSAADAGSMPRGVGLQAPASNSFSTASGEAA